jgi:hypothetical protein
MIATIIILICLVSLAIYASCAAASDADDKMHYDDICSHSEGQNETE